MADENAINVAVSAVTSFSTGVIATADIGSATGVVLAEPVIPNKTSAADFQSRYMTLESPSTNEGGADLAYIRILSYTDGMFGEQVFPTSTSRSIAQSTYQEFIVVQQNMQHVEKSQIIKTNKTLQAYFFDSQPEVINLSGFLKGSQGNRQDLAMVLLWDNLLRATELVRYNRIVEIGVQGYVYWGYPIAFQYSKNSQMQNAIQCAIQMLIVKRTMISRGSDPLVEGLIKDINTLRGYSAEEDTTVDGDFG